MSEKDKQPFTNAPDISEMPEAVRAHFTQLLLEGKIDFSEEALQSMAKQGLSKEQLFDMLRKRLLA